MSLVDRKECEKTVKPIFVLGVAHSGTTILYNVLGFHPDLAWFSQYSQRDGTVPGRFYLPFHALFNRVLRKLFKHDWQKRRKFWSLIVPFPSEAYRIWNYILPQSGQDIEEEKVRHRLKAIVCKEASKWHRSKIIFKMPRLSTEIALIREVFPDTLFIHIVRDGRAVALSNCHKFQRREKDKLKALCHSAEHWKEVVTKVQQEKRNTKHFWEIKYEYLCNDVHGYITQILNLAGLDKSRMPWHRCPTRLMPTNDKWLGNCSESEKLLLDQILGSTLAELGYESGKVVG